jgi:hypothetical protein
MDGAFVQFVNLETDLGSLESWEGAERKAGPKVFEGFFRRRPSNSMRQTCLLEITSRSTARHIVLHDSVSPIATKPVR